MVKLGLQSFLQNLPSFGPDMLRWPLKSEEPSWGYQQEERIKPNTTQIVVWGFNIFLYFFIAINCLLQTLNSLIKLKQRKKWNALNRKFFFFFFAYLFSSFSSFCWMCAKLYEFIQLYPNASIGFAILDQPIGLSMLHFHCHWHQMIHEALKENKLLYIHKEGSKLIVQCNIWGES